NAAGAQAQAGPLANAVEGPTGQPHSLALQNLIQAGLTEADARKVIDQATAALAAKQTKIKGSPLLATLPPVDGLKGNATEAPGEKLPVKLITPNVALNQSNAESKPDSNSNNASNANSDPFAKLASLLRNDGNANPAASAASPFKAAVNTFLNLNGATPPNTASAEGLAIQTGTAVASAGKSTEVFKPVLAQTYGQRGSVEKTVASQIIERISFRGMGSQKEIHIKLDPPSLGSVRVTVATTGDSVRTTIVTENHFVKHVIENNLPQLKDSLASQGIKVDQFSVLVGGNPEQNTAHQQESAGPKTILGPDHEDPRDTGEELVLTQGHVIFNESTINVFA
ncbi:MAG: flagellar hook-length control protein FliK, partial [Nitrospina sp.]